MTPEDISNSGASASVSSPPPAPAGGDGEENLVWRVHPLVERPRASLVLALLLGGILGVIGWTFPEPGWVLLSAVVLFAALAKYFLPTTYRFDMEGIEVQFLGVRRKYRWDVFRRCEAGSNGVFLSPFPRPHRLDNFRGLFVLCGARRDEVLDFVRRRIATP